jgi:hypothetical protein
MIAPVLAAVLAALAPESAAASQIASTPAVTPPGEPVSPPPPSPLQKAQRDWEDAQTVYLQSCSDRAYGAYDDLCSQLAGEVKQFRIKVDRLERAGPAKAAAASSPSATSSPPQR